MAAAGMGSLERPQVQRARRCAAPLLAAMGGARAKKGGQKKKNKIKGKGAKEGGPKSTPAGSSSSGGASGLSEQDGASAVPAGGSSPPAGSGRAVEAAPLVSDTGESDSDFVYSFEDTAGIEGVSIVHDDSGAVLSDSGERAWSWRQWDGGKVLARYLEQSCSSEVAGQVVVELGAGTGLVSLVAARLGAAGVAATDLAHGMDLLKHNGTTRAAICSPLTPPNRSRSPQPPEAAAKPLPAAALRGTSSYRGRQSARTTSATSATATSTRAGRSGRALRSGAKASTSAGTARARRERPSG